ncbi:MAG: alkaline phosphatase [Desulfuromonadaceae bacterium]|nr:alkaline phosphatase [Desulfuromonadaceae bacterium]MDD5104491.1 alkaline phosphatase [Desulfuromonadaceae bacterium]
MLKSIRRFKSAVSLVVIVQFMLTMSGCGGSSSSTSPSVTPMSAKNVILIIGDGMQLEHERAANNYLFGTPEAGLEHQTLSYKGVASTWDVTSYNRYAFGKYSSNGFSTKKYSDSTVDLNNTATFESTLGYDPAKGGKLPYRQDAVTAKAGIPYFSTKLKDSATGSAGTPATDSASAATALAAGFKTDSGNIAWRTGDPANGRLATIAEMYRNQKKASIGVVSTVPFSHATPAGFVSHNVNRNNYKAIAQEIIAGVRPDVVIGGGHPAYNSATSSADYTYIDAPEYSYLKNSTTVSDYNFVERKTGVDGGTALLAAADAAVANKQKLFGLFGGAGGNFDYHKASNDGTATITRGSIENPTLADASKAALKVLSQNSNGFFLMLEQGDIDWANHSNDYAAMIGGMWDLNNAVKAVEAFIDNKTNPNVTWDNTMVIVTSDHGNSYMRLQKDLAKGKLPSQTPNGAGAPTGYDTSVAYYYDPTEVTYGFNAKGMSDHTNELVTLYAKGAGSTLFSGHEGSWYPGTRIIDNTQIYKVMMSALGLSDENRTKVTGSQPTTFLYTSDAHYGIKRSVVFGSYSNAVQVNGILVRSMNNMPNELLPSDNGIKAGQQVGPIDFVAMTGDIANRQEAAKGIQSATVSWGQFKNDYINNINVLDKSGNKASLYLTPGNHDVSNAIGYTKALLPATDDAVMFNLYNMFMSPTTPMVAGDYNYATNRIVYSRDIGGVHFVFLSMWPDSTIRPLIDANLAAMSNQNMPVVLFTHDQPDIETKHLSSDLTNYTASPVALDWTKKFENLVTDVVADNDSTGILSTSSPSTTAQKDLADWLATKKNIVAYFHGNDNYTQNYAWTGTSNQINLNVFRVDSPMKGVVSGIDAADGKGDPSKLAYNVVTIDAAAQNMTVREYLWQQKKWGTSTTVSLAARSK